MALSGWTKYNLYLKYFIEIIEIIWQNLYIQLKSLNKINIKKGKISYSQKYEMQSEKTFKISLENKNRYFNTINF